MTKQEELALWEIELANAAEKLQEAQRYDNQGDIAWCEERMRWAQHKIQRLEAV